ncbi:MAG: hypothetical protein H0V37_12165 [Chloroflexia bacterium]|nr:hypothetical protein [Chloroflexia bacterium]
MRQSDVSRLERDQVTLPRHSRLAHIAAALDLTMGELLARAGWDGAAQEFQDGPSGLLPVATEPPTAREAHGLDGGVAAERRLLARVRATQARVQDLHRQLLEDRSRNPGSLAEASVRR